MPVAGSVASADASRSSRAGDAVLGRKQRGHLDAGCQHAIHVAPALAVDPGLVGDQPDALSLSGAKSLLSQHVEAGHDLAVAGDFAMQARAR